MSDIPRCARCVLPASLPSTQLDDAGVCAHCRAWDLLVADMARTGPEREQQLRAFIDRAKAAGRPYDCVVPLSGGKDSTYVLYLCSQVYGLRCLCVTLENGYLTANARENIENALRVTGVDYMTYRVNRETMLQLYGLSLRNCGMFCVACNRGIEVTMRAAAQAFDVPLIITGHGKVPHTLSDGRMPEIFVGGNLGFFKRMLHGEHLDGRAAPFQVHGYEPGSLSKFSERVSAQLPPGLPRKAWGAVHRSAKRLVRGAKSNQPTGAQIIEIYDYVDTSPEEIRDVITDRMSWRSHSDKIEHLDCAVEEIKVYAQILKYPEMTRTTIRHSGLVRAGRMTREEALAVEERQLTEPWEPAMLDQFLADLGLTRDAFETYARRSSTSL